MRVFVRILSALLGIALAAAGVALAVEVAWAWAFPDRGFLLVPWKQWRTELIALHWSDTPVQLIAVAAVIVGLLFIFFSAAARRKMVRMHEPAEDVSVTTSPRSLARVVGRRVREEEGVTGASVIATPKKVKVRAESKFQTESELRPRVTEAAKEAIDSLPLPKAPRISVVVTSRKGMS